MKGTTEIIVICYMVLTYLLPNLKMDIQNRLMSHIFYTVFTRRQTHIRDVQGVTCSLISHICNENLLLLIELSYQKIYFVIYIVACRSVGRFIMYMGLLVLEWEFLSYLFLQTCCLHLTQPNSVVLFSNNSESPDCCVTLLFMHLLSDGV